MKVYIDKNYLGNQYGIDQLKSALVVIADSLRYDDAIERVPNMIDADYCILYIDTDTILEPRLPSKRYYYIFSCESIANMYIDEALKSIGKSAIWKYKDPNGYEVSSRGDARFSPFCMYINHEGIRMSIEDYYHYYIKKCTDKPFYNGIWKELKGQIPNTSFDEVHRKSIEVYKNYLLNHPGLLLELIFIAKDYPLVDMFDPDGGQNKLYVEILNELYGQRLN